MSHSKTLETRYSLDQVVVLAVTLNAPNVSIPVPTYALGIIGLKTKLIYITMEIDAFKDH